MKFVLKMAWRDSRASRKRLLFFSFSVVLGIAALVAIGSFAENLRSAIDDQARGLLGADLAVVTRAPLTAEADQVLSQLAGARAREISLSSMIVLPTAGNQTRLVSVRGTEPGYPFYGSFETSPKDASHRLSVGEAVVVLDASLISQFGLKHGDPVKIGSRTFAVAGTLQGTSSETASMTQISPRAVIPYDRLRETGLLDGPSIRTSYKTYFKFPAETDVEGLVRNLRDRFRELKLDSIGFDTVAQRKRSLGQALENVSAFLNLVGFVSLFLGAIGVASSIHVYVRQKVATVAVLKCLGASTKQSFSVYLVQGLGIGLCGAVLGALLGIAVQVLLPILARGLMPFEVQFFISWISVARGMAQGVTVCMLFALLPLLSLRRISPLAALRSFFEGSATSRDPLRWALYGGILAAVILFALQQTPRWQIGLGFVGMLLVGFGSFWAMAALVAWTARRLSPKRAPYVLRQGLANLYRPNNRTSFLLLTLGLATFLMVTLVLTRAMLTAQIENVAGSNRPNLLFFDVQDDQIGQLEEIIKREGVALTSRAPIVTMRISGLKGGPIQGARPGAASGRAGRMLYGELRATYQSVLAGTEKVVAGNFVGQVEPTEEVIPVSLEVGFAQGLQLALGDELEFDVQGVRLKARVSSLREVERRRMEASFSVIFPAGALESAPKFFVASVRAASAAESARVQQAVVQVLPNVSAVDLTLILKTFDNVFSRVQFVVQFMASFTVITGVIVLVAAVMAGRFQRLREIVLLRTLGATRRQLLQIELVEYTILGLLAAVVGCGLALVANNLLARFVFATSGIFAPRALLIAAGSVVVATLVTGLLTNRSVADCSPLSSLREES